MAAYTQKPPIICMPPRQLLLKEVVEAQRHGIIFDCAHGQNHFSFPMIEKALDQGFLPDTVLTDLTFTSATQGPVFDLPTTMSKLLLFGMSLDDVVMRSTQMSAAYRGLHAGGVTIVCPPRMSISMPPPSNR